MKYARRDMLSYKNRLLLGYGSNESTNFILFNNWALHSLPVAVNTYTNVLLRSVGQSAGSITTINHPIVTVVHETVENLKIPAENVVSTFDMAFSCCAGNLDLLSGWCWSDSPSIFFAFFGHFFTNCVK